MIFKFIKASIAVVTLLVFSVATHAAELPIKAQPYIGKAPLRSVVAYYNWTGFYVGINGGYGFGESNWDSAFGAFDVKPKGAMVGGTLGYNWQAGSFVYGIEGDFGWSWVKGSAACGIGFTCETSNPWLGTIRGRLGYAFDRFLPYLTGGGAYGNIKAETNPAGLSASASNFGWTFGAGLEYAFLGNWSAKLEYLYVDLGNVDLGTVPASTVSFKENVIRAGLNYKFSGPVFSRF